RAGCREALWGAMCGCARRPGPTGVGHLEVVAEEDGLVSAGVLDCEDASEGPAIVFTLAVLEPGEYAVVDGVCAPALVFGEDPKELGESEHVLLREIQVVRRSMDRALPLRERRQLEHRAWRADAELVVDEAVFGPPSPGGDELGLEGKRVDHSSSPMRSAKKPFGQRSLNSPRSSTRSRRMFTPSGVFST